MREQVRVCVTMEVIPWHDYTGPDTTFTGTVEFAIVGEGEGPQKEPFLLTRQRTKIGDNTVWLSMGVSYSLQFKFTNLSGHDMHQHYMDKIMIPRQKYDEGWRLFMLNNLNVAPACFYPFNQHLCNYTSFQAPGTNQTVGGKVLDCRPMFDMDVNDKKMNFVIFCDYAVSDQGRTAPISADGLIFPFLLMLT